MMNTKKCIACQEEILIDALKCKHCHQIQTKIANLQNKPSFNYILMAVLGVFIIWLIFYLTSVLNKDPLEPSFEVAKAQLQMTDTDEGLNIRCIADIKNSFVRRWDDFSLQATFINANDEVIDVLYAKPKVSLYPLFSFQAMVSGSASAAKSEYVACKISVLNADDY